jgi:hypothetical protein
VRSAFQKSKYFPACEHPEHNRANIVIRAAFDKARDGFVLQALDIRHLFCRMPVI